LPSADTRSRDDLRIELACFELEGTLYAVEVGQVLEIVRCPHLVPLPFAPALIEGVVDLRGVVLPIVDLGRALGGRPSSDPERARIAVLRVDDLVFGLRVTAALDVLALPASQVESLPRLAVQAGYEALRAVVRRPGQPPVLVLSLDALLERVYRSTSAPEEAA
jgi:purine-binding chemotaxis protein CheW